MTTPLAGRRLSNQLSLRLYHNHIPCSPARFAANVKSSRYRTPRTTIVHSRRSYHSYEHDIPPPFNPTETAILSAALKHVPHHGFTQAALTAGARSAGYLDISTNLFPQGPFAIIDYHLVTQRLALAQHQHSSSSPSANDTSASSVSSNILHLATARLHANTPLIHHWQSALALLASPSHLPHSLKELALLADEILFQAGSTTVTTSWYTDRAGLAAIYASAELYMTTDKSAGFVETEGFLRRRLEEGEGVRRGLGMAGRWVGGQVGGLVDGLRSPRTSLTSLSLEELAPLADKNFFLAGNIMVTTGEVLAYGSGWAGGHLRERGILYTTTDRREEFQNRRVPEQPVRKRETVKKGVGRCREEYKGEDMIVGERMD